MQLKDLIEGPDQVAIDVHATDRWQLIDEMIGRLASTGRLPGHLQDAARAAVKERESTMSTGIGSGIGIPHAAVPGLTQALAVLAVSRHDVDFDALDGAPVHLAVLIVFPEESTEQHLDTLADIARLLGNAATRRAMIEAQTADGVLRILREGAGDPG